MCYSQHSSPNGSGILYECMSGILDEYEVYESFVVTNTFKKISVELTKTQTKTEPGKNGS